MADRLDGPKDDQAATKTIMRILFADTFSPTGLRVLTEAGHDCVVEPDLDGTTIPARIGGFDALVVRSTKVTADTIAAGDRLGLIVRAGAGTNTIDKQAAAERGVYVCNVPGKNAIAVAELAMGLMLGLDRRIPDAVADLRQGKMAQEVLLAGGRPGRQDARLGGPRLDRARGGLASDRLSTQRAGSRPAGSRSGDRICGLPGRRGVRASDAELFSRSDIISFHVPLNEDTRGLVNAELLGTLQRRDVDHQHLARRDRR